MGITKETRHESYVLESSLWQVLESNAPVKYYLSKKACEGIIRRVDNRGKVLPKLLETALVYRIDNAESMVLEKTEKQAILATPTAATLCASYGTKWNGNHGAYSGDNFVVEVIRQGENDSCEYPSEIAVMPDVTMYGLCSNSSNSMKSNNPKSGIYEAVTTRTLDSQGGNPSCNQGGMIIVEKDVKAVHESIAGDSVHISDVAYALRSGRKPLLLEEIRHETIGFDGYNSDLTGDKSATLGVNCGLSTGRNGVITLHPEIAPTLTASAGGTSRPGGGQGSELDYYIAYSLQGNMIGRADHNGPQGDGINENSCFTLNATDQHAVAFFNHTHTHNPPSQGKTASCQTARQFKKTPVDLIVKKNFINHGMMIIKESESANTQMARQNKSAMDYLVSDNANTGFARYTEGMYGTLVRSGGDLGGGSESLVVEPHYIVRRLTPTECERLQGFPDDWTKFGAESEKEIADTPRYQMLGNSVAIPCVRFILKNLAIAEKRKVA